MQGSIVRTLLVRLGSVFLLSLLVIGYLWIDNEYANLERETARYRQDYLDNQKAALKSQVYKIRSFLLVEKSRAERNLEQSIQQRTREAHGIASHIYQQGAGKLDDIQIQRQIRDTLRNIRFNDGRGYYFITALDRMEHLFPPNPALEERTVEEVFSAKGVQVVDDMIDIVRAKGEGFLRYDWPRPDDPTRDYRKYSYVKLLEPYGWIIGTGDYLEEFESRVRADIFKDIAKVRYGANNEGYFFINSYTGDLHVTNGKYFGGKENIWDKRDAHGKLVVQENARLAKAYPEGAFSRYTWKKTSGEEAEKLSFVLGMDEWSLFIGTGAYLDTMEREIQQREQDMFVALGARIRAALGVILVAALLALLVGYLAVRKLVGNFGLFQQAFNRAADSQVHIETERIAFREFQTLAESANSMIDAINRQREKLRHQAYHDHLTALPNRVKGMEHLAFMLGYARQQQSQLAVLFIDIDDFKVVNDTLGHSTGDRLLQSVSDRISSVLRGEDAVARLGGDEFLVITGLLHHPGDGEAIADKLLGVLEEPFIIDDNAFHVSVSIGVCLFPDDGDDAETLLRNADSAMYQAKHAGKNRYALYHDQMTRQAAERAALLDDLRRAIRLSQFELHYQPLIDVSGPGVIGVEALVRWRHPQQGLIPPDRFIPLAESSGLILAIGEWVLRQACRDLPQWRQQGHSLEYVAVNISARQLQWEGFDRLMTRVLQESGLEAGSLVLEITESMLMEMTPQVARELQALKANGSRLAIDDFGTGYSSLNRLKHLPISKLKIDRSFVDELETDENDRAIVRAVIAMARSLGLQVVAEGVETAGQAQWLVAEGCTLLQGFHFSQPLPADQLLEYIQKF